MMATEDHLVPASLAGKGREFGNLILSCVVCNRLKANFVPEGLDAKKERRKYIAAVRKHILERRGECIKEFMQVTHPGQPEYQ